MLHISDKIFLFGSCILNIINFYLIVKEIKEIKK